MKNISLDLVRVTEAGAIHASKWVGSGNKELADKDASQAMRDRFNQMDFCGLIKIGEGKKDKSFGLYEGEIVGKASYTADFMTEATRKLYRHLQGHTVCDIAIDPIEGTTPTVYGGPEAMSVVAIANKDSMYTTENYYMDKLVWGPTTNRFKIKPSLRYSIKKNIQILSEALDKPYDRVIICVLDRVRNLDKIEKLRKLGVRLKLIKDCDVSGGIAACLNRSGVDCYMGIGGSPEGVITAAAVKGLGGGMEIRDVTKDGERWFTKTGSIVALNKLIDGGCAFSATGITTGSILDGVKIINGKYVTHSMFMRSESKTVRWLRTEHGN